MINCGILEPSPLIRQNLLNFWLLKWAHQSKNSWDLWAKLLFGSIWSLKHKFVALSVKTNNNWMCESDNNTCTTSLCRSLCSSGGSSMGSLVSLVLCTNPQWWIVDLMLFRQKEIKKKEEWHRNHEKDEPSAWKRSIWLKSRLYPSLYTLQYHFLNSRSLSSCMFPNRGFPEMEESGDAHQNSHLANPKSPGPALICLKSLSVFKWCACVCVGGKPAVQCISTWTAATGRFPFSGRIQTRKANFFHANVKFIQEKEEVCSLLNPTNTHTHTLAFRMEKTLKTASKASHFGFQFKIWPLPLIYLFSVWNLVIIKRFPLTQYVLY